ncbi:hypothetical protein FMM05_17060 [Flavobacterium zepuense]|uniref:Lipoprotein n=1 Tax=Flavobacterium zepuense TaxID=2593302 RepID=A0A552UWJ7_9FLAO|nr:hypothetical protein [Flavobacterium zepuense]TRW22588.1 hypothetical protein FMM05_17060 [Flavobacterium zepuense]
MKLIKLLFIALLLQSCGARKTTNFKEETAYQQEVQENVQATKDINLNMAELTETKTESEFYLPIDPYLPMIITTDKGKQIKIENGIYSHSNKKNISKKDSIINISSTVNRKIETKNESKTFTKSKITDKKSYPTLIWTICIVFFILWFVFYKKVMKNNY